MILKTEKLLLRDTFDEKWVRNWIKRNIDRYEKDGFGKDSLITLARVAVSGEWFAAHGVGETPGHVLPARNKDSSRPWKWWKARKCLPES